MKIKTCRGQTLLESCVIFPLLCTLLSGLFMALYLLLVFAWSDFWTYRGLICLIEHKNKYICHKQLTQKLQIFIRPQNIQIEELWITKNKAHIKYRLRFPPSINKSQSKQIALPLINEAQPY